MASGDKPSVSYLGPTASYSHQAVRQMFPEESWVLEPVYTIDDVFDAVQSKNTLVGVVPFENSTNGSVVFTLDDLADHAKTYPDITVIGEIYVNVHHYLVGHLPPKTSTAASSSSALDSHENSGACTPTASDPSPSKPQARPLASLKHVKRLYSHPQAFGQCNAFTSTYLKGVEVLDASSTSRAAEIVAGDATGTWAAISSSLAADVHGVDTLARNIEDRSDNTTRFLIVATDPGVPRRWDVRNSAPEGLGWKSMISFTVPHAEPGALAEVLSCFKRFGLNLTSINSRPSLVEAFNYLFFVEFEGRGQREGGDGRVEGALGEIGKVAEGWRWLGSWERFR